MGNSSTYHRSLGNAPPKLTYEDFKARQSVFEAKSRVLPVYAVKQKVMTRFVAVQKKDQDFQTHATGFEKDFSVLCVGLRSLTPVVDAKMLVVGHYGWVPASMIWLDRSAGPPGPGKNLVVQALNSHKTMYVFRNKPGWTKYEQVGVADQSYRVMVDIFGQVLSVTQYRNRDGVEPCWVSPLDLINIARAAGAVGSGVVGGLIGTLARKTAFRKAGEIALKEVLSDGAKSGSVTVKEMDTYLNDVITKRPELQTLMNGRNLSGEALQKNTLGALEQWQYLYNRNVQFVEEGVSQRISGTPNNFLHLQGDKLLVELQKVPDAKGFFREVVHELTADALKVRGQGINSKELAFIGDEFNRMNNAMFILENAILESGGLKRILASYHVGNL